MDNIISFPADCPKPWVLSGYEQAPLSFELQATYGANNIFYNKQRFELPDGNEIHYAFGSSSLLGSRGGTLFVLLHPKWWSIPKFLEDIIVVAKSKGFKIEPVLTRADIAAYEYYNEPE